MTADAAEGMRSTVPCRPREAARKAVEIPSPASFSFSDDAKWLAIRLNRPAGDTSRSSGDLLLRNLATGTTRNIGNVDLYAFDDAGHMLAYTVDATGRLGNGIYFVVVTASDEDGRTIRSEVFRLLVSR